MSKSSEIVLNWINNEIQIEPKITNIKKSFSNGYNFAKILYLQKIITPEEFAEFFDTTNYSEIKSNFAKIQKICQNKFHLVIPEKDINLIIKEDIAKAVGLLYKIRNSIFKNNIHFNEIRIGNSFSDNEVQNQIKEILKRQFPEEEEEDSVINNEVNEVEEEKKKEKEKEEKSREEKRRKLFAKKSYMFKSGDNIDFIKEEAEEEKEEKDNNTNKITKYLNSILIRNNKIIKRNIPSIKLVKINKENKNSKIFVKQKTILEPINHRLLKSKNNSCDNIFFGMDKNNNKLPKLQGTDTNFLTGKLPSLNINSNLIDINTFNKKLTDLGITNNEYKIGKASQIISSEKNPANNTVIYKNQNKNLNYQSQTVMDTKNYETINASKTVDEVRNELRKKIKMKSVENKIKQEEIKRELNINGSRININFKKMNRRIFIDKRNTMNLFFKNYSNLSNIRRTNYSKELIKKEEIKNHEKKQFYSYVFSQSQTNKNDSNNNTKRISTDRNFIQSRNIQKKFDSPNNFNSKIFFENLNKLNYVTNKINSEKKQKNREKDSIILKDIIYFIIDMAMEGYIYQKQSKKELMDLNTFLKFSIYFLKNKPLRKKIQIFIDNKYKTSSKIDYNEKEDLDKIISSLTSDEKYLIQDYIYYLGEWNDDKIYDNKLRGLKLEYKYINTVQKTNDDSKKKLNINYFSNNDYEPTVLENEDLTLPEQNTDNFYLGKSIMEIIENKCNSNENIIKIENNNNKNIFSKWEHIPYKIALIGYPLSGRKTISEKINIKYPNIKIYSINKLIREYYQLFLKYSDLPERSPKNKNTKKKGKAPEKEKDKNKNKTKENPLDKQERKKKLKELAPIINIIQPYIYYHQNLNNYTSSITNTSKNESSNINNNEAFVMPDENLCKLIIKKIEEDFPVLDQEEINKKSIELQKNIYDLGEQIKVIKNKKAEAKKPNPKDDINIVKLEKEIQDLKDKSITGFILTDFPTNLNQCYLLENYLTGFIDEKRKPKSDENNIIEKISSLVDFKIESKNNITHKTSGLNFIVNISTKESNINERFDSIKYDPVEDKIYLNTNSISDKKLLERLVDEIPYLPKELFEYYKNEYNDNINKIANFYNQFNFVINVQQNGTDLNQNNNYKNDKTMKTYQFIEQEDLNNIIISTEKKEKIKKNTKKSKETNKEKGKDKDKNINKDTPETKENLPTNSNNNENTNQDKDKDKVYHFICENLIQKIFIERENKEKELFYDSYPKYRQYQKKASLNEQPELNINKIKTKYSKNSLPKKQNKEVKIIDNEQNKGNMIINQLTEINKKYNKYLGKFIHFIIGQKKHIYKRFILMQKKFRNYLNQKSNKKSIINNYVKKFNSIYNVDPRLLNNEIVKNEILSDIEELRTEIWKIISKKQNNSIEELKEIKNCGFIESELIMFYYHIRDLIIIETEKFLTVLNNMIALYTKKKERERDRERDKDKDNISEIIENIKLDIINKKEFILKDSQSFKYDVDEFNLPIFKMPLEEIIDIILDNIENIFKNCIKLLFKYNNKIDSILKRIKKFIYFNTSEDKKKSKSRKKRRKNSEKKVYSISMVTDLLSSSTTKEKGFMEEEAVKRMFLDEKNKYKFRICYIKSFATKYIHIMKCTAENIYNNMDNWIVKNVTLQSDSLSYLIKIFKQFLSEQTPTDQKNDVDYIELDEFEKVFDDEENKDNANSNINNNNLSTNKISNYNITKNIYNSNNLSNISNGNVSSTNEIKLRPFDNSSVINMNRVYNKINLEYLINENFIDTKIEEYIDTKNSTKNKIKIRYRIYPGGGSPGDIWPTPSYPINDVNSNKIVSSPSNDEELNNSSCTAIHKNKKLMFDNDFYFDLEKFKFIYKLIKKYEIEEGIINKDLFFLIFVKQFIFNKKKVTKQKKNEDDEEEEVNNKQESENSNLNSNKYPPISKALKILNTKNTQKIVDSFIINIERINYISFENDITNNVNELTDESNEESKEKEKDKSKRKESKKSTTRKNKSKKGTEKSSKFKEKKPAESPDNKDKDKNSQKEANTKVENNISIVKDIEKGNIKTEINNNSLIEYEVFLSTKDIFTFLALIGVNVLSSEMESKIENDLKEKYFMNRYLSKKDFMEYNFWFEPFFNYLNEKNENNNENNRSENVDENGSYKIKEFLFDVWKSEENGAYLDFENFLNVLKVNKYVTDYVDFNEVRYYDLIVE